MLQVEIDIFYRGLIVRRIKSDEDAWGKAMSAWRVAFPNEFRIGHKAAKKYPSADWLVKTADRGSETQSIRIQNGTGQILRGTMNVYASDTGQELERGLLNTGEPHVKNNVFQIAERDFR